MQPKITVVIPTYNRAQGLPKTLEHILNQSVPREMYRVIVVDNRSKDQTAQVMKSITEKNPTVSYAFQERPGAAPTRNEGVRRATTPLVLFIDDDILSTPTLIEEHLKGHEGRKCSVLGHLEVSWATSSDPFLRYLKESEDQNTFRFLDPYQVSYKYFYTGNVSCRREALLKVGGFDEGFTVYGVEDVDLGYRLEMYGERMIYRKAALAYHDYHPTYTEFVRKRKNAGRSLAYFLAKFPHLAADFSFGSMPLLKIGVPRMATAWMRPIIMQPTKRDLNRLEYFWFNKAIRWQYYKGLRQYRKFWNRDGLAYIPTQSVLIGNSI
jgi:glycosyltransferase involved in cell wall biosynthesis